MREADDSPSRRRRQFCVTIWKGENMSDLEHDVINLTVIRVKGLNVTERNGNFYHLSLLLLLRCFLKLLLLK